jgi:hypothetical protein
MEMNLPTPTTARVYVNIPESNMGGSWIQGEYPGDPSVTLAFRLEENPRDGTNILQLLSQMTIDQ